MILLSGNSLGERQKQLNEMVIKATDDDFSRYKAEPEKNDVDKMFLIDLASKSKNIDFIMETLKSGDILLITRALNKSKWIGDEEYANYINVDYLHLNIFPFMSIKMKKKLLSSLPTVIKNEKRSVAFYEYCLNEKMFHIAIHFLYKTSENYKKDIILQKSKAYKLLLSNMDDAAINFIGNSFTLAQTFLETIDNEWNRGSLVMLLHNLYSVSNEKYLDLLEKYKNTDNIRDATGFGSRTSKHIIKNHKARVLNNPCLYVSLLNKSKVTRNSTINDVKVYAVALLPDDADTYWNVNFYKKYQFILNIIPENEKFPFLKEIFTKKYPGETFEKNKEFYYRDFYNMMSNDEKENWALGHIASGEEILGDGNDYTWYKFVQFEKAFEEIKKYILITTDADKRMSIVTVLIDSAQSQNEIAILLKYFHDRHINEQIHLKLRFMNKLTEKHNVFDFNDESWILFEKLLYSLDMYNISNYNNNEWNYRVITLMYYILRGKSVPVILNSFLEKCIIDVHKVKKYGCDLQPEKLEMVIQYMLKFYHTSIVALASKEYNEDVKDKMEPYIRAYLDILQYQSKTKDNIPQIIYKFIKLNWNTFKYHRVLDTDIEFTEGNIVKHIKKDASLIINEFLLIKNYVEDRFGRTNWLIRKLKLYFHHDIAQKYLQLLIDCLANEDVHYRLAQVATYGILILADESFKVDFLRKYAPTETKIDYANTPRGLLHIQQAICAYAYVSRPPLPLSSVHQYLTGDYVHSCLPLFNFYLMNLPLPACISFVESLIDKPISIQKHGLRLAFQCFSTDNLKTLINNIWKRTKSVSIRKILYISLYAKVLEESDETQLELFEMMNELTLQINQNDDDEIFRIFSNHNLPDNLRGQFLINAWRTIKNLPERDVNLERMTSVIKAMETDLNFVPANEIKIIIENHVSYLLDNRGILNTENAKHCKNDLHKAKWELTLNHLANIYNEKQLKNNMVVVKHIMKKCIEIMQEIRLEGFVKCYNFCRTFIRDLENKSYNYHKAESYPFMKIVFNSIFEDLLKSPLRRSDIFSLTIQLRISDMSRNVIIAGKQELKNIPDKCDIDVVIRECLTKFTKDLFALLSEYIVNGMYFPSFHRQIDGYIIHEIDRINDKIDDFSKSKCDQDDLIIITCYGLLSFDLHDVFMIILRILPVNYDGQYKKDYQAILDKLKILNNNEVQYFLHEKFVLCNHIA